MPLKTRPTTGIPRIDEELAERLKLPRQIDEPSRELEADFPGCIIRNESHQMVTIHTVGAGWNLAQNATAVAAAGARMIAYDMDQDKIGLGQIGLTAEDDVFNLMDVVQVCQLMPRFTSQQLDRLPTIITKITQHPDYKSMMKKFDIAKKISDEWKGALVEGNQKYESDNKIAKVSKKELISVKNKILELLKEEGLLQIVHREITIGDMQPWFANDEPVLMIPGRQVNLKKMGLDHLENTPRFLKEFLPGSQETEKLIDMILEMQTAYKNGNRKTLPSVAFIGGGTSSFTCARDLLKRVQSELLEVVWISPEEKTPKRSESITQAERSMKYQYILGYVSELAISKSSRKIESVQVVRFCQGKAQLEAAIDCDLLVHSWDQSWLAVGQVAEDAQNAGFIQATERVTDSLDEKTPSNGLVRNVMILPYGIHTQVITRITEPWTYSLQYDKDLTREILNLVEARNHKQLTLVVTGEGQLAEAVKLLAFSLGYRGRFIQIAVPSRDRQVIVAKAELDRIKNEDNWVYINGRLVQNGTIFQDGTFSLGVCNEIGEKIQKVPAVDAIINAAGKVTRGPLIEAMLEEGYIRQDEDDSLHSTVSTLTAGNGVFNPNPKPKPLDSLLLTLDPFCGSPPSSNPLGWEAIFDFARQMIMSSAKPT